MSPARMRVVLERLVQSMDGVASIGYNPERHEALEQARAALAAPPPHGPLVGEPHRYRIECEVCGQAGTVQLSVEPQTYEGQP
jgi:hypothetical protein